MITPLARACARRPWIAALVVVSLFASDYALTLVNASHAPGRAVLDTGGSFELLPLFRAEVDALRWASPKAALTAVALGGGAWAGARALAPSPRLLDGALGAFTLSRAVVLLQHAQVGFAFWAMSRGWWSGAVHWSRPALVARSALDFVALGALFASTGALTRSPFVVGGGAGALAVAVVLGAQAVLG
jgi:hypothetical protein